MAYFSHIGVTRATIVFIVGIIVIGGLVFGGIWLVKERGEQARQNEAIEIASQNLEDQSQAVPSTDGATTHTDTTSTPETTTPATTGTSTVAVTTPQTTTQTTTELPTTGTELSQLIAVTFLALAAAFYVTSRRAVQDS